MPSIPQSLLWISLVVLWLFVLVPMLISKRDAVRRTSDVALATRVLNTGTTSTAAQARRSGGRAIAATRTGEPSEDDDDSTRTTTTKHRRRRHEEAKSRRWSLAASSPKPNPTTSMSTSSRRTPARCRSANRPRRKKERAESDELPLNFEDPKPEENVDTDDEPTDEYEERGGRHRRRVRVRRRFLGPGGSVGDRSASGRFDGRRAPTPLRLQDGRGGQRPQVQVPQADAGVHDAGDAGRPRPPRSRAPWARGACAAARRGDPALPGYLRRQTRIEERLRRRRMQRMARSRLGVENTEDREFDLVRRGCADRARWCWRSTTRTRSSSTSITPHRRATTTCRARRASNRRPSGRFLPRAATGSLCYRPGAMAQLVARLVRIE